jgi:hypothetical protein
VLSRDASKFARSPGESSTSLAVPRHLRWFQIGNLTKAQRKNLRRCEASNTPTSRFALIQSLQALLGLTQTGDFV